jgi:hypothetical protein
MTIDEAIRIAITGGYHLEGTDRSMIVFSRANDEYSAWTHTATQSTFLVPVHETLLDRAFWHTFGWGMGWETPCDLAILCMHGDAEWQRCRGAYWMYQWHGFIQSLAQGHPLTAFFAALPHPAPGRSHGLPGMESWG